MAKLKLSMLTGSYDIVRPLQDGTVQPEDIELTVAPYPGTGEIHDAVASGQGADINEFNGGHYVIQKAHGRDDIIAIPVFLHRRFRHGFVFVSTKRGIKQPSDLAGGRIGATGFGAAAAYWIRGYLEEAGAPYKSITWVCDRGYEDVREERPDVKFEKASSEHQVEQMLLDGEIDAIISPSVNKALAEGDPRVARLWPDYKDVETAYFKRTGFFPIMHLTTVPTELVAKEPWIVRSLTLAFQQAKHVAYQRLANPRNVPLAFCQTYWEEERALLGPDPWEYGITDLNQRNYDTLVGHVHDQVLAGPRPRLQDLFARESWDIPTPLPGYQLKYGF
jgi:4,5-dihydroxyphthalate decarboxylase